MSDEITTRARNSIGGGLQHERTGLAWERTAIAMMVAGVAMARYSAVEAHVFLGSAGITQTAAGGVLLIWAGQNYHKLHDPTKPPSAVPQVTLAKVIGLASVAFTGLALALAVLVALSRVG